MLLGPGRLARLAGFWQAAERVPHLLASASSTKGTSDVFLDTCRNGKCPIHIGAPLGARGREARALLEEATLPTPCKSIYGSLCFPPPPPPPPNKTGAVPLIPAPFAKLCLTKPSSLRPRGLMGTGWMESQHSPRFRQQRPAAGRGRGYHVCEAFGITDFPSFSRAGEGFQKPSSGGANSWGGELARHGVPYSSAREVVVSSPRGNEALKLC